MKRLTSLLITSQVILAAAPLCMVAQAQDYPPYASSQPQQPYYDSGAQAPNFPPQQLDALVGRIALYPDPLLAQVLSAATYYDQIPDADGWARGHAGLNPDDEARAIQNDGLPWDPSILALLPFPQVLDTLANDMNWTSQLGNAVLTNRAAVMDAVQRQRSVAMNYGYLQNNNQYRVVNGGYDDIEILPVDPSAVYVPYYDPYVVYSRPRSGFFIGGAITFGPRVYVRSFAPWGWGGSSLRWNEHRIVINNRTWDRDWSSSRSYTRPYVAERPQQFNDRRSEYRAPQAPAFREQQRQSFQQPAFRQPEVRQQQEFRQQPQQSFRQPESRQQPAFRQPEIRQQPDFRQQQFRQPEVRQQQEFRPQAPARQPEFRQPQARSAEQGRGHEDRRR